MPIVDMPLEQLKSYMGTNPRPDDFDEYWERGLKEMRETDPKTELVKMSFSFLLRIVMIYTMTEQKRQNSRKAFNTEKPE